MYQYDTFLSNSHRDKDRASRVKEHLDKAGLRVWMDQEQLSLGTSLRPTISEALRKSRSVTPILTQNALESEEVFREVKFGIDTGIKIIPIVLSPAYFTKSQRWRKMLSELNWGSINNFSENRNITAELLSDMVKAIRDYDARRCPIICVYHFKGGVGKTTVCAHLAAELYHSGKPALSILLIDCDAQSNLSSIFLTTQNLTQLSKNSQNLIGMLEPDRLRAECDRFEFYDVARGQVDDYTIQRAQFRLHSDQRTEKRFAIVPNSIAATKYGSVNAESQGLLFQNFHNAIQKISYEYDMILLDCNPSATFLSQWALSAATDIVVPLRNDKYTTDGLENIDELLKGNYGLDFSYGDGRDRKQLWSLVNFADLGHLNVPNEERSRGKGPEAELLKKFFSPISGVKGQDLSRFRPSLLGTRVPESGFLMSKPIATAPLDPDRPPTRNVLSFFGNARAKGVEGAIKELAREIYEKSKSTAMVVTI